MDELNFTFSMPDEECLAKYISIKGEKGDGPGATKTSELVNDSDFTTNAALTAGLATKADTSTVQEISNQVNANTEALASLNLMNIYLQEQNAGTGGRWYPIATLMESSSTYNSGSVRLHGKINGVSSGRQSLIDIVLANRTNGLIARGELFYSSVTGLDSSDFVVYENEDTGEMTLYLKLLNWNTVDVDVSYVDCTYDYDGTYVTTEPSGTLVWALSEDDNIMKNVDGLVNIDITGNAMTVNGFNVNKSVPASALFTDTVYDDSAIIAELEEKADTTDVATTYATKAEVQALASGSPIPVNSTSAMTDTSKTYLLTTDGYWYYYDGSDWVQGGVYQATAIADGSVTPIKTSFNKRSENLIDFKNATISNWIIDNTGLPNWQLVAPGSNPGSTTYIPVEGGKTYTFIRKSTTVPRMVIGFVADTPSTGDVVSGRKDCGSTTLTYTAQAPSNAQYAVINYARQNQIPSGQTANTLLELVCVKEGTDTGFVPSYVLDIKTDDLEDECVTKDKLSSDVLGIIEQSGRLRTRSKIYGIQFDITNNSPACTRIADAEGLKNDYVVGNNYQLNGGTNDFDNVFPYCDMRRCNLSIGQDGKKTVTYEGEDGFTLDGSNGNVMVEIPKFYSMRERVGDNEIWAITGEPKSGFSVEPAFVVNGIEQDYIYVGAYDSSALEGSAYSYSGDYPVSGRTLSQYISDYATVGLQSYDFTIYLMLQKLMTIEFATRNVQQYMGGITFLPYWYKGDPYDKIDSVGTNYVMVTTSDHDRERFSALWVGERIKFSTDDMAESDLTYTREITALETIGTQVKITYNGSDLSSVFTAGDNVSGCPQRNGWTDSLPYHTGRTNFASGSGYANTVNPMRYRYIENIYGNVWETTAGLKIRNLKYYYSFEPNYDETVASGDGWQEVSYAAPLQNQYGEGGAGYIVKQGYDINDRGINLPVLVGSSNGGGSDKYFADAFYSRQASASTEYMTCVGGGWDHNQMAGIFCLRCWLEVGSKGILMGNRPIYRG